MNPSARPKFGPPNLHGFVGKAQILSLADEFVGKAKLGLKCVGKAQFELNLNEIRRQGPKCALPTNIRKMKVKYFLNAMGLFGRVGIFPTLE